MIDPSTVGAALEMGRTELTSISDTPNLDSQLLLCEILGRNRAWVLAHPEAPLDDGQCNAFAHAVRRCANGEALPHVLGWWEFYGRRFKINSVVLIPRPETELMIEAALEFLSSFDGRAWMADVGTGSGCVAVTLSLEERDMRVIATDLSTEALEVARSNLHYHEVDHQVSLLQADLLTPLRVRFNLICANLPYIPTAILRELEVAQKEPHLALDGGADGLATSRRLISNIPSVLEKGGRAILEIGERQGKRVVEMVSQILPSARTDLRQDLAGHERLLVIDRMG